MKILTSYKKFINRISCLLILLLLFSSSSYSATCYYQNDDDNNHIENQSEKVVYLTFDDGPSEKTIKILEILNEKQVHATFFIISPYIKQHIPLVEKAYNDGNAIGNHTADHEFKLVYSSEDTFFKTFNKQQDFIKEVTGVDCTIFRFPGGSNNTLVRSSMGKDFTKNLTEKLNSQGINVYDWNVDSGDAKGNGIAATTLLNNVKKDIKDKEGNFKNPAIILMHDCMTKKTTVEALPSIIDYLKEEGYTFDVLK